jgi:hypothetical protein
MQTRVVLSTGQPKQPHDQPVPARLVVSVDLGHRFRALSIEEQCRAIEAALTDALEVACRKVEELHVPEGVAA